MFSREKILFEGDTEYGHYQVVDMTYEGRKARVLFTGKREAAFSGMPLDDDHDLLFDYIQRLYELACQVRPKRLLMIGGGTYTLPMALIHSLSDIHIDVVEIDPGLDDIAESFFGYTPNERLTIIHDDGAHYTQTTNNNYDMIIIDAFTDLKIPKQLAGPEAAKQIRQLLTSRGLAAINCISAYRGRNADTIETLYQNYASLFAHTMVYPADRGTSLWMSQNLILVAQKDGAMLDYGLRFAALDAPSQPIAL